MTIEEIKERQIKLMQMIDVLVERKFIQESPKNHNGKHNYSLTN